MTKSITISSRTLSMYIKEAWEPLFRDVSFNMPAKESLMSGFFNVVYMYMYFEMLSRTWS
jgi:hypothetical protein